MQKKNPSLSKSLRYKTWWQRNLCIESVKLSFFLLLSTPETLLSVSRFLFGLFFLVHGFILFFEAFCVLVITSVVRCGEIGGRSWSDKCLFCLLRSPDTCKNTSSFLPSFLPVSIFSLLPAGAFSSFQRILLLPLALHICAACEWGCAELESFLAHEGFIFWFL